MLDSILNYGRLALLGIVMAFMINPYYANITPSGIADDYDWDHIPNTIDVCLNENYYETYHEECLMKCAHVSGQQTIYC